jgi:hypothetical protein
MLSNDPRVADNKLTSEEAHWWELLLTLSGILSLIILWVSTIRHTFITGQNYWMLGIIFIWPLSLVYTILYPERQDL